ncbi:cold shock domain-containing protein [Actinoplanes regularis]|uniref:cold shock domain-containing protein n=1 Tax=Actinoplanes regularis TaxID=52697 RepID=UPI003D7F4972
MRTRRWSSTSPRETRVRRRRTSARSDLHSANGGSTGSAGRRSAFDVTAPDGYPSPVRRFLRLRHDVFAHFSAIEMSGFRGLEENQRAEFEVTQGPNGPQAANIRAIQGRLVRQPTGSARPPDSR